MPLKDYLNELFDGRILYDELSIINENSPLNEQMVNLQEDLLQVDSQNKKLLLDVGWYPEFSATGSFKIVVIEKDNWEKPLYKSSAYDIETLKHILKLCKRDYDF